eukprot:2516403-Pleurochrysis_carterae.AAC.5
MRGNEQMDGHMLLRDLHLSAASKLGKERSGPGAADHVLRHQTKDSRSREMGLNQLLYTS